ncbi:MAG: hypothetical protein ABUL71_00940 [Gemmatimonadota bacterium]
MKLVRIHNLLCAALVAAGAAHASAQYVTGSTTDPRAGLKAGVFDAATASKGMTLLATRPRADTIMALAKIAGPRSLSYINSDFVFRGNYLYQGNFGGFQIWDISNPAAPVRTATVLCTTDQGDPSIWGNLLFISDESARGRMDCSAQGIRIFDVSDPAHPRQVTVVQTCRGTHTHTLVPDPKDKNIVYIWGQGSSGLRPQDEVAGCAGAPYDPKKDGADSTEQFRRIEVVRVPLDHPENWSLVNQPHIFEGIGPRPPAHGNAPGDTAGRGGRGGGRGAVAAPVVLSADGATIMAPAATASAIIDSLVKARGGRTAAAGDTAHAVTYLQGRPGVTLLTAAQAAQLAAAGGRGGRGGGRAGGPGQCHDITVYPEMHLAAGACVQYGILMDITDPVHPKTLQAVTDSNFALWHSATFSNDGSKLLFSDEWGGGTSPRCRDIDPINWGGDVVFDLKNKHLTQGAFYKMPAAQTTTENCVAHNGGLVPVPGRDILVQGWYQGGVSVVDFTDAKKPFEIAYFDRGPIHPDTMYIGGSWGAYFYNGHVYSSEIYRGLDVFDLTPTENLTQNEIDAAKSVHFEQLNPQTQPHIVWPAVFPVARAYLDQLIRDKGLAEKRTSAIAKALDAAEQLTGAKQRTALTRLATQLTGDVATAKDKKRVTAMAGVVREMAKAAK